MYQWVACYLLFSAKKEIVIHVFERNNFINLLYIWLFAYSVYTELICYHLEGMPAHVGQM